MKPKKINYKTVTAYAREKGVSRSIVFYNIERGKIDKVEDLSGKPMIPDNEKNRNWKPRPHPKRKTELPPENQ